MDYDTMTLDELIEKLNEMRKQVGGGTSVYMEHYDSIGKVEVHKSGGYNKGDWVDRFTVKIMT